ncbi:kelch domain-containing protein 8A-like [Xenia sp. Carnegie-2017]|uniref:kelch domain-containing protein 8A-like n=1 Tax=Xenia sp. Carnegie-2017 TaxID=2897299 RepID=UPI001F0421EB|nr:kelch domain-containing protein 8A-like [Xenia sp. Carnegie-2017]
MPPLPHPLVGMATVQWRDQVVLLGGRNDNADILNDVIMYDSKVGEIKVLPSMLINRVGCCAVLTGDTIVVMGGVKNQYLKSVEFFEMESSFWKKLPSMNEARKEAIAEVLPITPKCNISMEKRKKSWKETKNVKKSCSTDIKNTREADEQVAQSLPSTSQAKGKTGSTATQDDDEDSDEKIVIKVEEEDGLKMEPS